MPVKALPKKLVKRLTKASDKLDNSLARMKKIDHRKDLVLTSTHLCGGRVREMDVSRNYPGVKLVIKRMHHSGYTASEEINKIKLKVKQYNILLNKNKEFFNQKRESFKSGFVLREPIAYDLGNNLVAMAKTNKPSLDEILGYGNPKPKLKYSGKTLRGKTFFRKLEKKYGVSESQLKTVQQEISTGISIERRNLILLGVEKTKSEKNFIIMPLVDLF